MSWDPVGYLTICLVAVVLHELGHVVVATALGVRVKRIGISWRGPYIVREQGAPLASFFIALAGPGMNLLIALTLWSAAPRFGFINLLLGAYNLIPFIPGLDGHNALAALRKLRLSAANDPV
jgi:Zn-dependent protease